VAICGRDAIRTKQCERQIFSSTLGRVFAIQLDLRQPGSAQKAAREAADRLGGIDILVNAAGAAADGRFEDVTSERWHAAMSVKLFGAIDMIREALPYLKAARGGVIVSLSGLFGVEPHPANIVSGTINAALGNFMKALASDLARYGIRAINVCPGPFMTERLRAIIAQRARDQGRSYEEQLSIEQAALPHLRFGQPDELGEMVAWLASSRSSYVTGTTITVDGGMQCST
jgi:3-oxoacyl-[acyl-carrier protein] reductase